MATALKEEDDDSQALGNPRGLFVAVFAFLSIFAASAVPIPLYTEYQTTIGLTNTDISYTMLLYLFGVVGTLFIAGSLSDASGRRPLTVIALILGVLGCFAFLEVSNPVEVLAARFVQGVSCGLAMSAVSALVVDSSIGKYEIVGVTIAGSGSLIGIMLGSIATGLFCMVSSDYSFLYKIIIGVLVAALVLIPLAPETVFYRVPLRKACKPVVSVMSSIRPVFLVATCAYIATWAVGTFYQSFSSLVAVQCFGMEDDKIMAAIILALAMVPSGLGGPIEARMPSGLSLRVGMVVFVVSTAFMCLFMLLGLLIPFLFFETLFSIAMGVCLLGSLRLLLANAKLSDTATVVSTINLVGYLGTAAASFLMGVLIENMSLIGVLGVFALTGLVAAAVVCIRTRKPPCSQ